MSDDEKIELTFEQAVALIPGVNMLIGADWPRKDILELFKKETPTLAGPEATRMKHGIACKDDGRWVFVQTRE